MIAENTYHEREEPAHQREAHEDDGAERGQKGEHGRALRTEVLVDVPPTGI